MPSFTLSSVYRLQFNHQFTLKHAINLVSYFSSLGVSHLYASPLLKAKKGSLHGYDVVDPSKLNLEIGSMDDFRELISQLRKNNMGLILDIVPNHMAIDPENSWWADVLKNGPKSKFAPYFDIDWEFGSYRRFFDIDDYIAMKEENPEVFEAMHKTIFEWIDEGLIDGLRIDHIDGLWDPYQYLENLSQKCPYIVIEKILTGNERIRPEWPVQGTVGYDFLNQLNGLFIDQQNQEKILSIYQTFTGNQDSSKDVKYACKKLVLNTSFKNDLERLCRNLDKDVVGEMIACFPVYRSYIRENEIHEEDQKYILAALEKVKRLNPEMDFSVFNEIDIPFLMQLQQLTGPIMAKGLEDTMFYLYYPLVSLNEVGGEPGSFGITVDNFHKKNQERSSYGFLTSTTHDTKRSEDVRARINVLSEIPEKWEMALGKWHAFNKKYKKRGPDSNEEYLIYQTLLGTWPEIIDEEYLLRIQNCMEKSLKEEKIHTSWTEEDVSYQNDVTQFIASILHSDEFLKSFNEFFDEIREASILNSISQVVLKLTSPGVPDIYQGNEAFTFNLVDPDSRRAVDFEKRDTKFELIQMLLNLRRKLHPLFTEGEYVPIMVEGPLSNHIIAFARRLEKRVVFVVTARFFISYDKEMERETFLNMPFTGERVSLKSIFKNQNFAVLF